MWLALGLLCALLSTSIVHELGHAFVAQALGARSIRVRLLPFRGRAPVVTAEASGWPRAFWAAFLLGGPLANALVAAAALLALLVVAARDDAGALLAALALLHGLYAALNLWPFAQGTDGRKLLVLLMRDG